MEIIVFAVFMVLWKGLDIAYNAYQLYLSAKVELNKPPQVEIQPEEDKHIGFINYGDQMRKVEEEEYEEE